MCEGPGKIGSFPGIVVGGADGGTKRCVDDLDRRNSGYGLHEPDITGRWPGATLLGWLALKGK